MKIDKSIFLGVQSLENPTRTEVMDTFGVTESEARCLLSLLHNADILNETEESVQKEVSDDHQTLTIRSGEFKSLDQALKEAEVDLDTWRVDRYIINQWGKKSQIKIWLVDKNKGGIDYKQQIDIIKEEIKNHKIQLPIKPMINHSGKLLEISIPDLHFGQLSWAKETGGKNYDVKIAKKLFLKALSYILSASCNFEKILLLIGSDFFNVNNYAYATAKGTLQDEDCRWQKSFSEGWKLARDGIELCWHHAPVDVLIIPGNHDYERSYYMGEVLSAWFDKAKEIHIDNSPQTRKYYHWGNSLIGFTHGNAEKDRDLPLIMATESEYFTKCKYREFHTGHFHQLRENEFRGIRVRHMPSLVPLSAWSAKKGYLHLQEAKGIVWDTERGNIMEVNYHV